VASPYAPRLVRAVLSDRIGELDGTAASHDAGTIRAWHDRPVALRVLLVDDHADFRASASALLEADGIEVVAAAADAAEALAYARGLRPDLVLLDIQLPGTDGFAGADALAEIVNPPAVVFISSRDAAAYGPRLAASGALGFIPKHRLSGDALLALAR
jgi:DNA-binding NarL/FixJ family response regulator